MEKEVWIWDCLEHETTWIRATDLEDATNIIMDALEKPTPYPEGWPPRFAPGEEVKLDRGKGDASSPSWGAGMTSWRTWRCTRWRLWKKTRRAAPVWE